LDELADNQIRAAFAGRRILITGGTGYLAAALIHQLQNFDCSIVRLGRSKEKFISVEGLAQITDVIGDVREPELWEKLIVDADIIFHLAAQTSVYVANQDAAADLRVNFLPMLSLLEACRRLGKSPLILFSGTVTEAGIPSHLPVSESHPDNPATVYDLHKLMAENYLRYFVSQGLVQGATLRLANVYGPGPRSSSADRGILNAMIGRALAGEAITVYGSGSQLRDYVFVEDAARAFLLVAAAMKEASGRHFVVGSGEGHTFAEAMSRISEAVARKTGKAKVPIVHVDPPHPQSPIEARNFVADTTLLSSLTGWRPQVSLEQGIDWTIEALL
jgi:nucleoside-diphosphate-sugar epimerase